MGGRPVVSKSVVDRPSTAAARTTQNHAAMRSDTLSTVACSFITVPFLYCLLLKSSSSLVL
jgi:hypothetical protein